MLVGENLKKLYGDRLVLKGVTIEVKRGEIVGLLGPNGAGKTTAFSIIAGLIDGEGKVKIDEKDITELSMYERARVGISFLPQEHSIFRGLTVKENIISILEHHIKEMDKIAEKTENLIKQFELDVVKEQKASTLSGGEKRRLEIARAISFEPQYLLLDEPFTGIDPIAVSEIQRILIELKKRNLGILISDHNVFETLKVVDKAYILESGEILSYGDPSFVASDPKVKEKYLGRSFEVIQ